MKQFVRLQKIPNVINRVDYISRSGKYAEKPSAENLICYHDNFKKWEELSAFERSQPRVKNQALELIIALPNQMADLAKDKLIDQANLIASETAKNQPYAFALHWNKEQTNLHIHLLLSERTEIEPEKKQKKYRQDIWAKADGKRAMKKEDRHHIMHHKGDLQFDKKGNPVYEVIGKAGFSIKNPDMARKTWLETSKNTVQTILTDLGYPITSHDPKGLYLPQKHVGKAKTPYTARLTTENKAIRVYNAKMAEVAKITPADQQQYLYAIKGEMVEGLKQASKTAVNSPQEIVLPRHLNQLESLLERILGRLRDFKVQIDRFLANQKTKQKISKIKKTLQASNLPAYKDYLVLLPDHKAYQVAGPLNKLKLLTKERQYTKIKQSLENKGFFKAFPALAQITSTKELVKTQRELKTALDDLTRPKPRKRQQTVRPKPIKPKNKESVLGKIKKHQETIRQKDQNIPLSKEEKNLGFER